MGYGQRLANYNQIGVVRFTNEKPGVDYGTWSINRRDDVLERKSNRFEMQGRWS